MSSNIKHAETKNNESWRRKQDLEDELMKLGNWATIGFILKEETWIVNV